MAVDFLVGIVCGVLMRISNRLWLVMWLICLLATGLYGWIPLYRNWGTPPAAVEFSWLFFLQRFVVTNIGAIVGYGSADWVARGVAEIRKEVL